MATGPYGLSYSLPWNRLRSTHAYYKLQATRYMSKTPAQYSLLHYARGLAALAVVFHHRGVNPKFPGVLNWISEYGHVGVSIFFVISGFVVYQSAERHFSD